MDLDQKEKKLQERQQRLAQLEQEILEKEKALKLKEKQKKQLILRLPASLWQDIAIWAEWSEPPMIARPLDSFSCTVSSILTANSESRRPSSYNFFIKLI